MVICDVCKEEGHGNEEDYGRICDHCLRHIRALCKKNETLEKENEKLTKEIERLKEWEVKGYWGP